MYVTTSRLKVLLVLNTNQMLGVGEGKTDFTYTQKGGGLARSFGFTNFSSSSSSSFHIVFLNL